jgi:hypothetical protein
MTNAHTQASNSSVTDTQDKREPKVRRAINLLQSQDEALRQIADLTGIPRSELVRRAIESMLDNAVNHEASHV